jgi:hypothetical protein
LSVSASVGFSNYVKIGKWAPLFVTVKYQGEPTPVEIRAEASVGMETTTTLIKRDQLGSAARKMFVLYFRPNAYTDEVRVTVRAGGHTATQIVQTEVVNQREPFVVILSDSRAGQAALVQPTGQNRFDSPYGSQQTQIVYADPRLLPDRWYGYHGVDLLTFSDISPRRISADAAKVIEQWVHWGGKITLFGGVQGPQWKGTWLERLLPVDIGERTRVVTLPRPLIARYGGYVQESIGSIVVTDATLKDKKALSLYRSAFPQEEGVPGVYAPHVTTNGYTLLASVGNLALVAKRRIGRGSASFIAFDDWHAPVKDWIGLKNLLAGLARMEERFQQVYYYIEAEEMGYAWYPVAQAVADVPAMEVPSRRKVALLLLSYVALVGPLHFLIGRKTRRLFVGITFPLTIALFSYAAYRFGRNIKGQHVLVNEIALTEAVADSPIAHTRSLFGILSPDSTSYTVKAADDRTMLSRPPAQWGLSSMTVSYAQGKGVPASTPPPLWALRGGPSARQREEPNATLDETETLALKDVNIRWGAMELFRTEGLTNLGKGIRARLTMDTDKKKLQGFIENATPHDLEECFFVLQQGQVYHLANLPAGSKVTADKMKKYDWRKFERVHMRYYDPYAYEYRRDPKAEKKLKPRERVMRTLYPLLYMWGGGNDHTLLAWVKKPASTVAVRPRAFESRKWQLLVVRGRQLGN